MTGGLWALTMHANYFGDTLLFTGWTLASSGLAVSWTWWAVPVMTALFVFMHIPGLDTSVPCGPLPEGVPQVRRDDGEKVPRICDDGHPSPLPVRDAPVVRSPYPR